MIVRELVTLLGFKVDRSSVDGVERATQKVKDQANQAAGAFRNVLASVATFASIGKLVQIGDEMQSLRARVGMLPQTLGDVGEAFDAVAGRANNAFQSVEAYASFYVKAGQATQDFIKDQEELMRVVDGAAFGLAASGATAAEQGQAFFQLGQAIGSPTVQMEEMNTLIDAAPELFRALGKAIPGANGNLKAFISTGKVSGKMLAEGLTRVLPEFEKKMRSMPLSAGQAMTLVGNRFKMGVDKLNRQTMFITRMANLIIDAFDTVEGGVTKLIDSFGGLENMLRFVGIAMGVAFGAKTIQLLNTFTLASLKAALPFIAIVAAIAAVAIVLEDLYVWINGGESLIGSLIGPWSEWRAYVVAAVEMVSDVFSWLGDLLGAIGATLVGLFTLDSALFIEGIKGIGSAIWDLISTVVPALVSAIVDVFSWIVKNLAGVLLDAASAIFSGIGSLLVAIGDFLIGAFSALGRGLMSILPGFIVDGFKQLTAPLTAVFDALGKIFMAVFTLDVDAWLDGLGDLTTALVDTLTTWGAFILAPFLDGFAAVVKYFAGVGVQLGDMLYKSIFEPIVNAVSNAWKSVKNVVSGVWDRAKLAVGVESTPAANTVAGKPTTAVGAFMTQAVTAAQTVSNAGGVPGGFTPSVSPMQMSTGGAQPSISSNTTVNLTVPAGTSAEQTAFLQNSASKAFSTQTDDKLARDLAVYAR